MATGSKAGKEDPIEKLRTLIREEIQGDRKTRDREEEEKSNPSWGKLRQVIREEVGEILGTFGSEVEKGKAKEKPGKPEDEEDGDGGKILGGLFG